MTKRIGQRDALFQPARQGAGGHVVHGCEIGQAERLAIPLKPMIAGLIAALLAVGSPSAVARLVPFGVVDSIDCHSDRALSHVFEESREVLPSFANGDACSAVIGQIFISASLAHSKPDAIFGRALFVHYAAMDGHRIDSKTSATPDRAANQMVVTYDAFSAASAGAPPVRHVLSTAIDSRAAINDRESTEDHACQIALHIANYINSDAIWGPA